MKPNLMELHKLVERIPTVQKELQGNSTVIGKELTCDRAV